MSAHDFYVEPKNGELRRMVTFDAGGKRIHVDRIDPYSSFARDNFVKAVKARWYDPGARFCFQGDDTSSDTALSDRLLRTAEQVDKQEIEKLEVAPEVSYRHLSSKELFTGDFRPKYIIDGVLAENEQCLWAGPEKGMKTSTAMDAAVAIDVAGYWLGRFRVERRRQVAVMSGEAGAVFLQDVGRRICAAAGHDPEALRVEWFLDLPILGDERHRAPLSKMLVDFGIEVLILDCSYLMIDGDGRESSIFFMGGLLRWITEICRAENVTLILVHHALKTPIYSPITLAHVAWAGFGPWAAQWVLVNRREEFDPNSGFHRLWLSIGSRVGHGGRWCIDVDEGSFSDEGGRIWQVEVSTPTEAKEDAERQKANREADRKERTEAEHARKLHAAMLAFPQGETARVLREASGLNSSNFGTAIRSLLNSGRAEKFEIAKKGGSFDGYRPKG